MRILHILPKLEPSWALQQLLLLQEQLPDVEFESQVVILADEPSEFRDSPALAVSRIGRHRAFDPAAFRRLKAEITAHDPDIVHVWNWRTNRLGQLAAVSAGARRIVASQHRDMKFRGWVDERLDRWLAQRSAAIVVNHAEIRDVLVRQGISAEKVTVIPSGIRNTHPASVERGELLAELGLPSNSRLIGTVGRLVPEQRLKDLIWALDLLKVVRDDVHLLVVGDGPHRGRLERFRRQVQIDDKVHFLGMRDDVERLRPHWDAFCLAREDAGQPLALLEALTWGVPVVAADVPGTHELIRTGENGFLVRVGDRAGFARAMSKLLDDRELALRIGATARSSLSGEFGPQAVAARYASLYRQVAA
jgi:glycosyltransferase involved in cell wall biosynthesis